jgi:hypothetical protein
VVGCYFASSVSGFVAVDIGAVIAGGGRGCSVTGPSPLPSSSLSFPWCFLGELATRCFRAFSSNTSSSVDSPKFLQHPRWVEPERDPGFSVAVMGDRGWRQRCVGVVGFGCSEAWDLLKLSATRTDSQQVRTRSPATYHHPSRCRRHIWDKSP